MLIVSQYNGFLCQTVTELQNNKQQFYVLDGLLNYAARYYKQAYKDIQFPYKLVCNELIKDINGIIHFNKTDDTTINITIQVYKNNNVYGNAECVLGHIEDDIIVISWQIN